MDLGSLFALVSAPPLSLHRPASLILVTVFLFALKFTAIAASLRIVTTSADLLAAFGDASVTHIQLANSITVSATKGPGSLSPVLLGRDCLVAAAPGSTYPRLDFNFATVDRVVLGLDVTLTFRGLVLSNAFSTSLLSLDFFAQSPPSSSIVWDGVVDRRSICKPLQEIRDAWANAPRPGNGSSVSQEQPQQQQQLAKIGGPNCNGNQGCYSEDVLRAYDVVVDSSAGYRLRLNNTLTVCDQFISQTCIQSLGSDLCYLNAVEELMATLNRDDAGAPSSSGAPGPGGLSSGAKAGIIAGCVLGGSVLLLALLAVVLACRRRRSRRTAEQYSKPAAPSDAAAAADGFSGVLDATGLAAFGSSRSGDTAPPSNTAHQPRHPHPQQQKQQLLAAGKAISLREGRPSHDTTTNSTDVRPSPGPAALTSAAAVAALESGAGSGTSGLAGGGGGGSLAPSGGGLRPSGSGTRELPPRSSSTATAATVQPTLPPGHSPQLNQMATTTTGQPPSIGGAAGGSTQSVGSAVMAVLRSVLSRTGSRTNLHGGDRAVAAAAAAAAGPAAQGSVGGASTQGSGVGSGAGRPALGVGGGVRRVPSIKSGTLGSARGSSGGQLLTTGGSGRPSIGEIQQELERMEEQVAREQGRAGGGGNRGPNSSSPASAPRGRSPRTAGGGGGGGAAGAGGPASTSDPPQRQAPPPGGQGGGRELQPAAKPPSQLQS